MIALRKEETGVLVMKLAEHLWPEDLELAIPVVHDVARSRQNPLLLLVEVADGFETSLGCSLSDLTTRDFGSESPLPSCSADNDCRRARINTFRTNTRSRNSLLQL